MREIWRFDNRWHIALTRIFFPAEKTQFYRYKGLDILIDRSAGDANGAREVLTSDMYRQYLPLIKNKTGVTVLDLGANNGGFPLLLKAEGFDLEKIVCVELNPQTFGRLRFNLERNFKNDFTALNCAVSGVRREITVSLGDGGAGDNIYRNDGANSCRIQGLDFDEIYRTTIREKITDICKIDVEGAEFEIFGGNNFNELRKCRYLMIEIHHEKDRPRGAVLRRLREIGFEEVDAAAKNVETHCVHFFTNQKLIAPNGEIDKLSARLSIINLNPKI